MATLQPIGAIPPRAPSPLGRASGTYTHGLPAPPRVLVAPPHIDPLPASLVSTISNETFFPQKLQEWKYESRREAQQILGHVWLGPSSAARDANFLRKNGITQLLSIRSGMAARANFIAKVPEDVQLQIIDVESNYDLISKFTRAHEIIDQHVFAALPLELQSTISVPIDGKVLTKRLREYTNITGNPIVGGSTMVMCETGNDRSAAVVASYIMQHLGATAIQAIQMIQAMRFCACFDDQVKWMLTGYEPIWLAKRQSAVAMQGQKQDFRCQKQKRRMDDSDDESEESLHHSKGQAPFVDDTEDDMMEG